jgi:hypothetical protein
MKRAFLELLEATYNPQSREQKLGDHFHPQALQLQHNENWQRCMQFHWQNVCNSSGKIYAIPLAECMQFHWQNVCDYIWMMPLDLKCFTQVNSNGQVLLQANRQLRMTLQQCNPFSDAVQVLPSSLHLLL